MSQLEKPIEQHEKFKDLFPDPKGVIEFTQDKITALFNFNLWESTTDVQAKNKAYGDLSDGFKLLARKKLAGTTTFLEFAPVARVTSLSRSVGQTKECGKVSYDLADFGQALPDGYEWLKSADRSTRTGVAGKWQRVEEWLGAKVWDDDLYPEDASVTPTEP